jgi:hypothetical protein
MKILPLVKFELLLVILETELAVGFLNYRSFF